MNASCKRPLFSSYRIEFVRTYNVDDDASLMTT